MLYVDRYSFFIAAIEFLIATICIIAIVMDLGHKDETRNESIYVRPILFFSMLAAVTDGISYIFNLNSLGNAILINKIILFIDFFSYISAFYLIYLYIIKQLPDDIGGLLTKITTSLMAVNYVLFLTNPFTNFVYHVDENNEYIKCVGINLLTGILFVLAVILTLSTIIRRRSIEKIDSILIVVSLLILIIGGVLEVMLDDYPGTNIGIGIVAIMTFIASRSRIMRKNSSNRYILIVMCLFIGMSVSIFCTYAINVSAIIDVTKDNSKSISETEANMINESIVNSFIKPITVSETMAQSSNLQDAIITDADTDVSMVNEKLVEYLASIRDGMGYQMVFAVSDLNKKFYTYEGISKIVNPAKDAKDLWYTDFLDENKYYSLNVDTDESNNWELSVFVNTRVNDSDGNLIGVCGVGVSMEMLKDMIADFEKEYGVAIYIANADGLVQVASNGSEIEKKKLDNSYFKSVNSKVFYYERMDEKSRLTKYDESLDWYIVIVDEKPDKISVLQVVVPGLIAAIASITLLLVAYIGINRNDSILMGVLAQKEENENYLKKITETDALTGLYNRYAYEVDKKLIEDSSLDKNLVVMIMDVNGLKSVNDSIGHDAGDELIKGVASCISKIYAENGKLYRIGGDEFALMLSIKEDELESSMKALDKAISEWKGELINELSVSIGYARYLDNENMNIDELINVADEQMYENKARYYRLTGKDRRR